MFGQKRGTSYRGATENVQETNPAIHASLPFNWNKQRKEWVGGNRGKQREAWNVSVPGREITKTYKLHRGATDFYSAHIRAIVDDLKNGLSGDKV